MSMDKTQRRALILTALVLGGGIWFLNAVSAILLPFLVGLVLAYLLNPTVSCLHRYGVPRSLGAAMLVASAISLLVTALVLGAPLLIEQLASFIQRLPVYLMTLQHFVVPDKLSKFIHLQLTVDALLKPLGMIGARGAEWTMQALQKVVGGVAWLVNVGLLIVMTPMVAFYLLIDWPTLHDKIMEQLPRRWRKPTNEMWHEIDTKLDAYLRGTMGVCAGLALYYAVALSSLGWMASLLAGKPVDTMELGWAIGLATGFLAFLPVIGGTVGVGTMLAVALVQYQLQLWEPYALIGAIFMLGQVLEGYVLTPLLVGQRVGLHPLWVIFALLAGGTLGGITGMLLAIPVAVVVSVTLPRVLRTWRAAVD
jgi:predicted PurR-regulated permease PerM